MLICPCCNQMAFLLVVLLRCTLITRFSECFSISIWAFKIRTHNIHHLIAFGSP